MERVRSLSLSRAPSRGGASRGAQVAGGDPVRGGFGGPEAAGEGAAEQHGDDGAGDQGEGGREHEPPERPPRCQVHRTGQHGDQRALADRRGARAYTVRPSWPLAGLAGEQPVRVEVVGADALGPLASIRPCWSRNTKSMPSSSKARSTRASAGRRTPERRSTVGAVRVARPSAWSRSSASVAERPQPVQHQRAQPREHQRGEDGPEDRGRDAAHAHPSR